jgi:hypothetical protein
MLLFPLAVAVGVIAGYALGGRLGGLADLRLRWPLIVVGVLVAQAALSLGVTSRLPTDLRLSLLVATYIVAGAWIALNLPNRPRAFAAGLALAGVGWLCNLAAIVANGGMPVSTSALARIGTPVVDLAHGGPFGKHVIASAGAPLGWLGDTIAIASLRTIVSIGDLVMLAGIAIAIAAAMQSHVRLVEIAGEGSASSRPSGGPTDSSVDEEGAPRPRALCGAGDEITPVDAPSGRQAVAHGRPGEYPESAGKSARAAGKSRLHARSRSLEPHLMAAEPGAVGNSSRRRAPRLHRRSRGRLATSHGLGDPLAL